MEVIDFKKYKQQKEKKIKILKYSFINESCAERFEGYFKMISVELKRNCSECEFTIYEDDLNLLDLFVYNICEYFQRGFISGSKLKSV